MSPPLEECLKNPPVKDEIWDRCVRRSSIGIGIGGLLGAVSSVFLGTGGVVLSMGLCVTWAVNHCRALFREQIRAKEELQQLPPCPSTPEEKTPICETVAEPQEPVCDTLPIQPPTSSSCYSFPPVLPIPDRPFARVKKEEDECECVIVDKKDFEDDGDSLKIECTCPVPHTEENEYTSSAPNEIPDFIIECTTPEEPSHSYTPLDGPNEVAEEPECTCHKIEEPAFECLETETKPTKPECTCHEIEEPVFECLETETKPTEPQCTCPED